MFVFETAGSTLHFNTFTAVLAALSSCPCLGSSAVASGGSADVSILCSPSQTY